MLTRPKFTLVAVAERAVLAARRSGLVHVQLDRFGAPAMLVRPGALVSVPFNRGVWHGGHAHDCAALSAVRPIPSMSHRAHLADRADRRQMSHTDHLAATAGITDERRAKRHSRIGVAQLPCGGVRMCGSSVL